MKRKIYLLLPFILVWMMVAPDLSAQVRIGEGNPPVEGALLDLNSTSVGTKGGLLLPNVDIPDLEKIPGNGSFYGITSDQDNNSDLTGTIVYNTNAKTGEGLYLWDGKDWLKLDIGGSVILTPNPGNTSACSTFEADGACENGYTVSDPSCKISSGVFTFTWISGETFIDHLNVLDAGAGTFTVSFLPNDRASDRQALLMVTSSCGNSNIFVFTQTGDITGCTDSASDPKILSQNSPSLNLCGGGAAYLYLDTPLPGTYIWTLNGAEVGRGTEYIATQPGRYIVYANKIGCTTYKPDTAIVNLSGTGAPAPVRIVVNTNNGVACGTGNRVKLIADIPATGSVLWYKDGVRQAFTTGGFQSGGSGEIMEADKGEWFAVVEDGSCASTPSAPVTVTEDPNNSPVPTPDLKINGKTGSGWSFCKDGSLYLEVDNLSAYNSSNAITWYADNTEIGQGSGIYYKLPDQPSIVIRCRVTGPGCAAESHTNELISVSPAPAPPAISGTPVLCGGNATLTANTAETGATFTWYRDGVPMAGLTGPSIIVTTTGNYTATVTSLGGCTSQQSAVKTVTLSDYSVIDWIQHPQSVDPNTIRVYEVGMTNGPATDYNWVVTGDATLMSGQGTSKLQVQFGAANNTAKVEVYVKNACGEALPTPLECPITITAICPEPKIQSPKTDQTIVKLTGQTVTFTANFTDESSPAYQWYKDAIPAGILSGETNKSLTINSLETGDTGDYFCVVTNGCPPASPATNTATSKKFMLTVEQNPSTLLQGAGSFSGKLCFDIAETSGGTDCGELGARQSIKVNFASLPVADKTYTFKASGNVTNVRFVVDDSEGCVDSISPLTPIASLTNGGTATVTVHYKTTLNSASGNPLIQGRSRTSAAVVKLYAVFHNGTTNVAIPLTIKIQDCACCGAKTTTGGWLNFMCHNLGANENLDPFTPASGLYGDLYQWGRQRDGHEKGTSRYGAQANNLEATDPSPVSGRFITGYDDWLRSGVSGSTTRWGNGTQDADPPGGTNNPCPPGWKVPSQKQWASITTAAANTWTWISASEGSGYKVGQALFLPASGWRNYTDGRPANGNAFGWYWSSTVNSNNTSTSSHYLIFTSRSINTSTDRRAIGGSVRCISQ